MKRERERIRRKERGCSSCSFLQFVFFNDIISICTLLCSFYCTHCDTSLESGTGCQRALCLESSRTRKQCTLTLPLPLQNWRDCDRRGVMGHVKTMPLQVSLLSLLPHTGAPAKSVDVYLCTLLADTFVYNNSVQTKIHSDLPCFVIHFVLVFYIYMSGSCQ